MIKIYPNRTLADARQAIRDHGLDRYDYVGGIGTAEGFANRLFVPGIEMTTEQLVYAFDDYLEDCAQRGTEEVDKGWRQEADELLATLRRRACKRQAAADFIRDVKLTAPGGRRCWQAVAFLATSAERSSLVWGELVDFPVGELEALQAVLRGLEALEPLFHSWYALPYRPGQDPVEDDRLRLDIERFDVTLETAEPWTGQGEDWFVEASALLRLAKDADVQEELAMLIDWLARPLDGRTHGEADDTPMLAAKGGAPAP